MGKNEHADKWYFGWNIVAVATLLTLLSMGLRLGIGPFFLPMAEDLGFSRSLLSTIVALAMLFYGLAMPPAGWLVTRTSTRFAILLGTVLLLIGAFWSITARSALGFFLAFAVLLSTGLALISPVTLTPLLSRWFVRQRGMALFFLSTGAMAGIAVVTPLLSWGIVAFGWRATLFGYALIFTLLTIPATLFVIREQPPQTRQSTSEDASEATATLNLRQALATRPFWQISLGLFACGYSMNLIGTQGVPMLMDHGFDAATSSMGIGLIGLVAIGGCLVLGRISDAMPRHHLLAFIYFIRGLAFLGLLLAATRWQLYAVAAIGGLAWAGSTALSSAILADIYGLQLVGVLYGSSYLGHQVAGMISTWLGGWGYDAFGTHWLAFGSAAAILMLGGLISLFLPGQGYCLPLPRQPRSTG